MSMLVSSVGMSVGPDRYEVVSTRTSVLAFPYSGIAGLKRKSPHELKKPRIA